MPSIALPQRLPQHSQKPKSPNKVGYQKKRKTLPYPMVSAAAVKLYHGDQHDDNLLSCWEVARKSLGEKKQVVTRLVVTVYTCQKSTPHLQTRPRLL